MTDVGKTEERSAYLGIKIVQCLDGSLNVTAVYGSLNLLPRLDGHQILLWLHVCLLREPRGGIRIALHSEVIEYQSIDFAINLSASLIA